MTNEEYLNSWVKISKIKSEKQTIKHQPKTKDITINKIKKVRVRKKIKTTWMKNFLKNEIKNEKT